MTLALYPGSFDPITYGHLNLVERGLAVFDHLIVAVADNVRKTPLFTATERTEMIRAAVDESVSGSDRVEVVAFSGLLSGYAMERGAQVILRGLRAISDFEFEFQFAHMSRRLAPTVETVFMMTGEENFFVSSSMVREIASFGGPVTGLVPSEVERRLRAKFAR